jgi:hypothetical protein
MESDTRDRSGANRDGLTKACAGAFAARFAWECENRAASARRRQTLGAFL